MQENQNESAVKVSSPQKPKNRRAAKREARKSAEANPLAFAAQRIEREFTKGEDTFAKHMGDVAKALGGTYLFDLPASGLAKDCLRIGALHLPLGKKDETHIIFALLDADGETIRAETDEKRFPGLISFAQAFIDVLARIDSQAVPAGG